MPLNNLIAAAVILNLENVSQLERLPHINQHAFDMIPDELISKMLLFTVGLPPSLPNFVEAFRLSHINRRFMRVACATTELCTSITRLDSPELIETVLSRSGTRPFHVMEALDYKNPIDLEIENAGFARCLELILSHAPRLETLKLAHDTRGSVAYQIIFKSSRFILLALQALHIEYPHGDELQTIQTHDGSELSLRTMLTDSHFPALRDLLIPHNMLYSCTFPQLVSLTVMGDMHCEPSTQTPYTTQNLLHVLVNLPQLKHLVMEMLYGRKSEHLFIRNTASPMTTPFSFQSLTSFTFEGSSPWVNYFLANMFEYAEFSELKSLSLKLTCWYGYGRPGPLSMAAVTPTLATTGKGLDKLHILSLSRSIQYAPRIGSVSPRGEEAMTYDVAMLQNMPNLRDVSLYYTAPKKTLLEGFGVCEREDGTVSTCVLPALEKVSLFNSHNFNVQDIETMVNSRIKHSNISKPLRYLRVQDCKYFELSAPLDVAELHTMWIVRDRLSFITTDYN